ncbi:D-galactarate dehydratase [Rubellimicrobium sp. CFH 75288]|nr:D-galactarate dehydratase [Rubellimicrobium sp. CFH 75288]NAZ35345.1 D-galactarate dehydratase [Rubellimicrobium sp. CFH 75288]
MTIRVIPLLAALPLLAACVQPDAAQQAEETVTVAAPAAAPVPAARPEPVLVTPPPAPPPPPPPAELPAVEGGIPAALPPGGLEVGDPLPGAVPPPPPAAADESAPASPASAPAPTGGANRLGTTVASLGPPGQGGMWLETPLVTEVTRGRIEYPVTGRSVTVELRPSGGERGSGSQISLEAMREIGAPLTALPEIVVFRS